MHKLSWVKLIRQMFEAMVGNFAYSGDIHLFINVINGALVLYCEDAVMLRFCMATYINAGHQFRNVFALNGYAHEKGFIEFRFFLGLPRRESDDM